MLNDIERREDMINPDSPRRQVAIKLLEAKGASVQLEGLGFIMPPTYYIHWPNGKVDIACTVKRLEEIAIT